jgi:hypothetical protein
VLATPDDDERRTEQPHRRRLPITRTERGELVVELPGPFVAETERHDAGIAGEVAPFFVASDLDERGGLCVRREPNAPAELDQILELDGRVERPDQASGAGPKRCRRHRTRRVEEELDPGGTDAEDGNVRPVVIVTGGADRG